jgi:hypothetical protein
LILIVAVVFGAEFLGTHRACLIPMVFVVICCDKICVAHQVIGNYVFFQQLGGVLSDQVLPIFVPSKLCGAELGASNNACAELGASP